MLTDPIADMLTRLRNANTAMHDEVKMPASKQKVALAKILKQEGYITDYRTEDARVGKSLVVQLKYGPSRERSIAGLRRVSKPGLRVYAKSTNLPRVLGGLGVAIISTVCFWGGSSSYVWAYIAALIVILCFGLQDDRLNISPAWKFFGQGLSTLIIIFYGQLVVGWYFSGEDHLIPSWIVHICCWLCSESLRFWVTNNFTSTAWF